MADVMQGLVSDAKKNKYSTIGNSELSDEDIVSVWDNVSAFIDKNMALQKGVNIPGLGTFTFIQKKLDVGNSKFILIQRPVFQLSEKFAQTHALVYTKHHISGQIPVVQLNFAALSYESPFERDIVEACVKEVLGAMARSLSAKKNVDFGFAGIGRLQIRDGKVKMKFYKDFLNSMDGSGKLVEALKDRPGTVDSVISNRSPSRPFTSNTLVLPRITQGGLALSPEADANKPTLPTIDEEVAKIETPQNQEPIIDDFEPFPDAAAILNEVGINLDEDNMPKDGAADQVEILSLEGENQDEGHKYGDEGEQNQENYEEPHPSGSRANSRMIVPMAKATGVSFSDDLVMPQISQKGMKGVHSLSKSSPSPMTGRQALSPLQLPNSAQNPRLSPLYQDAGKGPRSQSAEKAKLYQPKPPGTACGHNAGQELCYLCHQRDRRNIPVSFTEERKQRESEEDRLLQQYQHMKDTEAILAEQEQLLGKRHDNQKVAAFNLGASEAIKSKKFHRPQDFHPSYMFQKRPLTPPRFIKQEKYFKDLSGQVASKEDLSKKRRADEEFLERLEQVQLAEDLAAQREQFLKDKKDQQEQYKRALSAQVRFKPLALPERVPDSLEPVFGKYDMTNEEMASRRRRAHALYKEQLSTVESRKREAILKRLSEQKEEEEMLTRTKKELFEDRADRYRRLQENRKKLEGDWFKASEMKKLRESEERMHTRTPGMLVHEQCDRYKRCTQCERSLHNCGESNIWRESRYIPGSRLMV